VVPRVGVEAPQLCHIGRADQARLLRAGQDLWAAGERANRPLALLQLEGGNGRPFSTVAVANSATIGAKELRCTDKSVFSYLKAAKGISSGPHRRDLRG